MIKDLWFKLKTWYILRKKLKANRKRDPFIYK